jgi:internalin A
MDVATLIAQAADITWPEWQEIVLNQLPQFSTEEREQLIRELLRIGDTDKENRPYFHLLAVACLETISELADAILANEVQKRLRKLLPRNAKSAQTLAEVGTLAIRPLEQYLFSSEPTEAERAASFRALVLMESDQAWQALNHYARTAPQPDSEACLKFCLQMAEPDRFAELVLAPAFENEGRVELELSGLKSLRILQYLTSLKKLHLDKCNHLDDITLLASLTELEELSLEGFRKLSSVAPLAGLTKLRKLNLPHCSRLLSLDGIGNKPALEELFIPGCEKLESLTHLVEMPVLKFLDLSGCIKLRDISALARLSHLEQLNLRDCGAVQDISSLARLSHLEQLNLHSSAVQDLGSLTHLSHLKMLEVDIDDETQGISGLASLSNLEKLDLNYAPDAFCDLIPLSGLRNLRELSLRVPGGEQKLDLAPLAYLEKLRVLTLSSHEEHLELENESALSSLAGLETTKV